MLIDNPIQYNTRADAITARAPTYNTGRACKHGHLSPRYTSNMMCLECLKDHRRNTQKLAKNAKSEERRMVNAQRVQGKVWLKAEHTTILHTLTRLLTADDADQFVTWLNMIDQAPLTAVDLVPMLDYREGIAHNYMSYPQRHDDAGLLLIELRGAWYYAEHVMDTMRGKRADCRRAWE